MHPPKLECHDLDDGMALSTPAQMSVCVCMSTMWTQNRPSACFDFQCVNEVWGSNQQSETSPLSALLNHDGVNFFVSICVAASAIAEMCICFSASVSGGGACCACLACRARSSSSSRSLNALRLTLLLSSAPLQIAFLLSLAG